MKRNLKKILCLVAVLAMVMSVMAGCGDKEDKPATSDGGDTTKKVEEQKPATALTEEEYKAEIDELSTAMTNMQTDMQTELAEVDPTDKTAVGKVIEKIKAPFEKVSALTPPTTYEEAHKKIKSGCDAFIEYFDYTLEIMEDPTKATELQDKLAKLTTTAQTDFVEGLTMMQ